MIGWCAFDYNTHYEFGSGDRICYHGVMDMFRIPKFAAYAYIAARLVLIEAWCWSQLPCVLEANGVLVGIP